MSVKSFFKELLDEIKLIFSKKLPAGWEQTAEDLINGLNSAKTFFTQPGIATIAALFPNGIGTAILDDILKAINGSLPVLEIAVNVEDAVKDITDPVERANAVFAALIANISNVVAVALVPVQVGKYVLKRHLQMAAKQVIRKIHLCWPGSLMLQLQQLIAQDF